MTELLSPPTRTRRAPRRALLCALAAVAFLAFLGRRDVVTSHEGRVVQTARAMSESGWPWAARAVSVPQVALTRDEETGGLSLRPEPGAPPFQVNPWVVPVMSGQVRLQKPPLPYWCAAVLFKAFGGWGEGLARAVPALLGALATLLVAELARRVIGRRAAVPAGLLWVSSYFVPDEFRKAMADPYLAFFALAAVWAWTGAVKGKWKKEKGKWAGAGESDGATERRSDEGGEAPQRRTRGAGWLLAAYSCLGLGFLAKGPAVFVPVGVALVLYHVLLRRGLPGPWWGHLLGLCVAVGVGLPWYAWVLGHVPHATDIWRFESVGELTDNEVNARPWHFYLPLAFQMALPWTPLMVVGLLMPVLRRVRKSAAEGGRTSISIDGRMLRRTLLPLAWFVGVGVFFSFVNLKKLAYLLPVTPGLVLLEVQAAVWLMAGVRRHGFKSLAGHVLTGQTVLVMVAAAVIPVVALKESPGDRAGVGAIVLPVAVAGLFAAAWGWRELSRRHVRAWAWGACAGAALVLGAGYSVYQAEKDARRSPRPAAAELARLLSSERGATVAPARLPPEVAAYLPLDLEVDSQAPVIYHLADDPRGRLADPAKAPEAARRVFEKLYPGRPVDRIDVLPIPGERSGRYKLFRLHRGDGRHFAVAERLRG